MYWTWQIAKKKSQIQGADRCRVSLPETPEQSDMVRKTHPTAKIGNTKAGIFSRKIRVYEYTRDSMQPLVCSGLGKLRTKRPGFRALIARISLDQLRPVWNQLIRYGQYHCAIFPVKTGHQAFGHDGTDLLGRKIHNGDHLLAQQ